MVEGVEEMQTGLDAYLSSTIQSGPAAAGGMEGTTPYTVFQGRLQGQNRSEDDQGGGAESSLSSQLRRGPTVRCIQFLYKHAIVPFLSVGRP